MAVPDIMSGELMISKGRNLANNVPASTQNSRYGAAGFWQSGAV